MNLRVFVQSIVFLAVMTVIGFGLLVLTSCATMPPEIRVVETPLADRIPMSLLTCKERPAPGNLPMQSDVGDWIIALDGAGADCRSKNQAIGDIVEADTERLKSTAVGKD